MRLFAIQAGLYHFAFRRAVIWPMNDSMNARPPTMTPTLMPRWKGQYTQTAYRMPPQATLPMNAPTNLMLSSFQDPVDA